MARPIFTNFPIGNPSRKQEAIRAFNDVRILLGKANSALMKCLQPGTDQGYLELQRYITWFGPYTQGRWQTVYNVVHDMLRQLRDRQVVINYMGPGCTRCTVAYVDGPAVGAGLQPGTTIHLCTKFFTAPLHGNDSQVGTILHETSHLVGGTNDHWYNYQYTKAQMAQRAHHHPNQAVDNADSYEWYIESFTYR